MLTWQEFEVAEPTLAAIGKGLLFQFGVGLAFLSTVRKDGAPRVHPVCPILADNRLYVFIDPNSPKKVDLLHDSRFAMVSYPPPREEDESFYLAGCVKHITAPKLCESVRAAAKSQVREDEILFEFKLDRAMHTTWADWGQPTMHPVQTKWKAPAEGHSHPRPVFPEVRQDAVVTLREVTEETLRPIIRLSNTLAWPQKNMVAPNAVSIAEAHYHTAAIYRAIYADETPVGFMMWCPISYMEEVPQANGLFLWRFMVGRPYQGKGFGRRALELWMELGRSQGAEEFYLTCGEGEGSPEGFYRTLEFERDGKVYDDEVGMKRKA